MATPHHHPNIGPRQSNALPHTPINSVRVPQQAQLNTDDGWRMLASYSDLSNLWQAPGRRNLGPGRPDPGPDPGPGPGPGPGIGPGRQRNSGNPNIQSPPLAHLPSQDRPGSVESRNMHEAEVERIRSRLQRMAFQTENEGRRGQTPQFEVGESGLVYLIQGAGPPETETSRLAHIHPTPPPLAVRAVTVQYQTAQDRQFAPRQRRINSLCRHQRIKQELWAQNILQLISACPDGDTWVRLANGYGCSGFTHFVGDRSLGSGEIEIKEMGYQLPNGVGM